MSSQSIPSTTMYTTTQITAPMNAANAVYTEQPKGAVSQTPISDYNNINNTDILSIHRSRLHGPNTSGATQAANADIWYCCRCGHLVNNALAPECCPICHHYRCGTCAV
ncbi:hypothetical protein N7532_006429 [Penicillium argentinense]|uniref:RanBP2-type domain-containing protein n=1 Tax=Penicillium argentinense TaxID=1131581 RepID=A0A9W9FFT1_9EURO|nr:uncharacterized protein N7532_006429 [Penicillium argentinense]KAJ5099428.1 hypothetical protein N7532_006429 [Penicillium argentinense]